MRVDFTIKGDNIGEVAMSLANSASVLDLVADRNAAVARAEKAEADLLEARHDADCTRLWMLGAESKREIVAREMDRLREWKGVAVDEIAGLRLANDELQTAILSHRYNWRRVAAACGMSESGTAKEIAARVAEMKAAKPAVVWVTDQACGPFRWVSAPPKTCGGCRRYNSTGPDAGTCDRFGHHVHGTGNACGHPVAKGD